MLKGLWVNEMIQIIKSKNQEALQKVLDRSQFQMTDVNQVVEEVLNNVKENGDEALQEYTKKFDGVSLDSFRVTEEEIKTAYQTIDPILIEDLSKARDNIMEYHVKQLRTGYELNKGNQILGQRITPIASAGIYVPGGTAAYPSTVLMNAVPAKIAGVGKIVMVTPPQKDGSIKPSILVAADLAGVDEIYKLGGSQAVAALTYGTKQVPAVKTIVGPGNIYVAIAKKMVSGIVGIDMIAGPSEILIVADESANPSYVAADLISQAEHDKLAASILVTTSEVLAKKVDEELIRQVALLERDEIITASLHTYGTAIIVDSLEEAFTISNKIAPEHLEILTENPLTKMDMVQNAGAIFLGEYTPEPVGDYFAGTNHTLPTSGTAAFSSPLSVDDFVKKTSYIYYSKEALENAKDSIIRIATDEGLTAHANAIKVRF